MGSQSLLVNKVLISSQNTLFKNFAETERITRVPISHSLREVLKVPLNFLTQTIHSLKWAFETRSDIVLFVMASPFDLVTMIITRFVNQKIVFICHETKAHSGERWPTETSIATRVKLANLTITLSQGETENLSRLLPSATVLELFHPIFSIESSSADIELDLELSDSPVFLFLGRFKEYKGLERLVESWSGVDQGHLIIAGEGELKMEPSPNITLVNRWLSEAEIAHLVEISDVVVFPYLSASQSGLVPYVRAKGKKIVASRLPGFLDQLSGYDADTYWVNDLTVEGLRKTLKEVSKDILWKTSILQDNTHFDHSMVAFLMRIQENWSSSKEI
jgi:glycosyltransferase involved in cell wall biosynthesis